MKKVLLASTALVAFAGAAAAEISLSGSAEMGFDGGSTSIDFSQAGVADSDVDKPAQFRQNVDVTFSMSGETDGGLAFGVSVDLDEQGISLTENDDHGVAVFISGNFGTLTMGDTDGALDKVLTEAGNVANPGSIADNETDHVAYLGSYADGIGSGDGQIVRYDYTFDAFEFALSVEQQDTVGGVVVDGGDDLNWAIGFGYNFEFGGGNVDLGIGYQSAGDGGSGIPFGPSGGTAVGVDVDADFGTEGAGQTNVLGFSATANLDSGFAVGIQYSSWSFENIDDNATHIGLGAGYSFDAFSVHANYGQFKLDDVTATGFGLAAAYDLGGGASVHFGYNNSSSDDFDFGGDADGDADEWNASSYSLGLSFSF